jgi:hypothetical protein
VIGVANLAGQGRQLAGQDVRLRVPPDHEQSLDSGTRALQHQVGVAGLPADRHDLGAQVELLLDVVGPVQRQAARHQYRGQDDGGVEATGHRHRRVGLGLSFGMGRRQGQHVSQSGQRQRP